MATITFALPLALGSMVAMSPPPEADTLSTARAQLSQPEAQPQPYVQPQAQPQPQPQPDPYAQPQPDPYAQPQPQPDPYAQPQPDPYAQPQPQPQPQPTAVAPPPESRGIGMLVAAPLVTAIGLPFSFLGNVSWRDNCGPADSNSKCADGTAASIASHTMTGFAYGVGAMLGALGGSRLGKSNAKAGKGGDSTGFIIAGGLLVPASLIGMGMVRLFLWLPTPDCETYSCVARYQTISTAAVGGMAVTTALGAAMLTYGISHKRHFAGRPVALLPQFGRSYAGIGLQGQF